MKKFLSVLGLAAILATAIPSAMASPNGGHGGGMGGVHNDGGRMHGRMEAPMHGGNHHGPMSPPPCYHRHNGGAIALGLGARHGYWGYPYYRHGLAYYYDNFYYPPYYDNYGYYSHPNWGVGVYLGF